MTNMLEIIYYSKTTWLGIQVVFDTSSTFTCFFLQEVSKKKRGTQHPGWLLPIFYSKKDKKSGQTHDQKKNQLLHPSNFPTRWNPTFMWPCRPSSCFGVFTIFSSVFEGTPSGTSRRSSMAPAITRISAVNAKLHRQTWKMTETAQQEILLLVVSFLFSKFGESTKNRTEGLQQSRRSDLIKSGSLLQQI